MDGTIQMQYSEALKWNCRLSKKRQYIHQYNNFIVNSHRRHVFKQIGKTAFRLPSNHQMCNKNLRINNQLIILKELTIMSRVSEDNRCKFFTRYCQDNSSKKYNSCVSSIVCEYNLATLRYTSVKIDILFSNTDQYWEGMIIMEKS